MPRLDLPRCPIWESQANKTHAIQRVQMPRHPPRLTCILDKLSQLSHLGDLRLPAASASGDGSLDSSSINSQVGRTGPGLLVLVPGAWSRPALHCSCDVTGSLPVGGLEALTWKWLTVTGWNLGKKVECSGVAGLRGAEPTIGERGRVLYIWS